MSDLLDKLSSHLKPAKKLTFERYLQKVKENPKIADTAFQRLYNAIIYFGTEEKKNYTHYKLFDDPFNDGLDAVYGLDVFLDNLVKYFRAAAEGYHIRERMFFLHGPPGSGKSSIIKLLKKGLEAYTKTDEGALYTFEWANLPEELAKENTLSCPINEEPLRLIPIELRKEYLSSLNKNLRIEGSLCPSCYKILEHLLKISKGDLKKVLTEHIIVYRISLLEQIQRGIASLSLKGGFDRADREQELKRKFLAANRGILELGFKMDTAADLKTDSSTSVLLEASQERKIEIPEGIVDIDVVTLIHTNDAEKDKLTEDKFRKAFIDRLVMINVPYVRNWKDEEKIYAKSFKKQAKTKAHLAPHVLDCAAKWAVMTRYNLNNESADNIDEEEWELFKSESANKPVSPRFVQNILSSLLIQGELGQLPCITPYTLFELLEKEIKQSNKLEEHLESLNLVREQYERILVQEVKQAIMGGKEAIEKLFQRYLNLIAKLQDPKSEKLQDTELRFVERIESEAGCKTDKEKKDFRNRILETIGNYRVKGKRFTYKSDSELKQALENILSEDENTIINAALKIEDYSFNILQEREKKKLEKAIKQLRGKGYCEHCAKAVIIRYAKMQKNNS